MVAGIRSTAYRLVRKKARVSPIGRLRRTARTLINKVIFSAFSIEPMYGERAPKSSFDIHPPNGSLGLHRASFSVKSASAGCTNDIPQSVETGHPALAVKLTLRRQRERGRLATKPLLRQRVSRAIGVECVDDTVDIREPGRVANRHADAVTLVRTHCPSQGLQLAVALRDH